MTTIAKLAGQLTRAHPTRHDLLLRFDGLAIEVRTNSDALQQRLADYFRDFVVADGSPPEYRLVVLQAAPPEINAAFIPQPRPDPSKRLKEEYVNLEDGRVVRKVRSGMVFLCGHGADVAVGPCESHDNQVINFINSRYMKWLLQDDGVLLHAAAVASGDAGLALTGFSGAGKSTLALHLLERGRHFVSNDRLIVRRTAMAWHMLGIPKQPRANPGTLMNSPRLRALLPESRLRELAAMSPADLWHLEDKHDVDVQRCFDIPPQRLRAPMSAVVVLNWRSAGGPTASTLVDLQQRQDLLPAIWKDPGLFIETRQRQPGQQPAAEPYLRLLSGCPVCEITGGVDFAAAVQTCEALLRGQHPSDSGSAQAPPS